MSTVVDGARNMTGRPGRAASWMLLRVAGAGLLFASAAIHLDLYLTGYRTIPVIGWLFLLQVAAGFAIGAIVLATPSRLAAAAGAALALSTLGGYLLTVQFGLFGFREVRTTAGIVAAVIEVAGFAALAVYAAARESLPAGRAGPALPALPSLGWQPAWLGAAAVVVVAFGLLGGALAGAGSSRVTSSGVPGSASAGAGLRTTTINGVRVLTNAAGRTLYWFGPDTPSKSVCNGSCAAYWPPVHGPLTAAPGVTGRLSTIKRTDGSTQETYDGHPLYAYVGDSGPGQAHGNNLYLNGGLWHEMTVGGR